MTMLAAWLAPGLDRIEQAVAAHALVVLELKRQLRKQARFVPPGFVPLALAGFLFVVAAGVQESMRERGRAAPRHRTSLRNRAIAYASAEPRRLVLPRAR